MLCSPHPFKGRSSHFRHAHPTVMTSSKSISQGSPSPYTIFLGIRLQRMNFRGKEDLSLNIDAQGTDSAFITAASNSDNLETVR